MGVTRRMAKAHIDKNIDHESNRFDYLTNLARSSTMIRNVMRVTKEMKDLSPEQQEKVLNRSQSYLKRRLPVIKDYELRPVTRSEVFKHFRSAHKVYFFAMDDEERQAVRMISYTDPKGRRMQTLWLFTDTDLNLGDCVIEALRDGG